MTHIFIGILSLCSCFVNSGFAQDIVCSQNRVYESKTSSEKGEILQSRAKEFYKIGKEKILMTLRQNYSLSKIYSRCFSGEISKCNLKLIDESRVRIYSEIKKMRLYLAIIGDGFSEVKAVESHFEIVMKTNSIKHLYQDFGELEPLDQDEIAMLKRLYNKKIAKWAVSFDANKSSLLAKKKYQLLKTLKLTRDTRRAIFHNIRTYNRRKRDYLNEKLAEGTLGEKFIKKYHELIHKLPILTKFSQKNIDDDIISDAYNKIGVGIKEKIDHIDKFDITFANIFKYKSLMLEIAEDKPEYCIVVKDAYERYLKPMSSSQSRKHFIFLGCSLLIKAPFLCSAIYLRDVADDFFLQRENIDLITSHIENVYYLNDNFDQLLEREKQNYIDLLLTPLLLTVGPIANLSTKAVNFAKNIKFIEARSSDLVKFEKAGGFLLHKDGAKFISSKVSFSSYFQKMTGGSYLFRPVHGATRSFEKLLLKKDNQFAASLRFVRDIGLSIYLWSLFESIPENIKKSKSLDSINVLIKYDPRFSMFKALIKKHPEKKDEIVKGALELKKRLSEYLNISTKLQSKDFSYKNQEYYSYILGSNEMTEVIGGVYSSFFNRYAKEEFMNASHLSKREDFKKTVDDRHIVLPLIHEKNILYSFIELGAFNSKDKSTLFHNLDFVREFSHLKSVESTILMLKNKRISYLKAKVILKNILFAYSYQRELDALGVDLLDENGQVSIMHELLQEQVDELINIDL